MSDRAAWVVLGLVFLDEVLAVLALGVTWGLLVAVAGSLSGGSSRPRGRRWAERCCAHW